MHPGEDSDQPGYPPNVLRVFAVRMEKPWVLSYPLITQRGLWSVWADAQADLSLRWVQRSFRWFCRDAAKMSRLVRKRTLVTPTNHSHAKPRSIQNVHKRSVWFSIRGVKKRTPSLEFSELISLKSIYVKYKNAILSHID